MNNSTRKVRQEEVVQKIMGTKWGLINKMASLHLDEVYFLDLLSLLWIKVTVLSRDQRTQAMLHRTKNVRTNILCDAYLYIYISITVLNDNDINI